MSPSYGGWTGRLLYVDLDAGRVRVEESWPHLPRRIGAAGLGLALLWERVPAGAAALDPENLLFVGAGPLTGSWAPCSGRAVAISLSPAGFPVEHVGQSSVGGQWPAELKWAGYDAIAVQGRSPHPVFLAVHDDEVRLLDARSLWGKDTFAAQRAMQETVGDGRAKALVIGPAGEKLARNASLVHGTGHALGQCGFGAVAGSKNLKGILVRGSGLVRTATRLERFLPRLQQIRGLLALMQSVLPADQDGNSRWRARQGLSWPGGDEPVPVGPIPPEDLSRQGMRHCGSDFYMGGLLGPWHVKNSGCTGCVMSCFSVVRGRDLPPGIPDHAEQNCVQSHTFDFARRRNGRTVARASAQTAFAGKQLADLLGVNCYDVKMLLPLLVQLRHGAGGSYLDGLEPALRREVLALPWDSLDEGGDGGLSFCQAFYALLQQARPGEDTLGAWLLQGTPRAAARFGMLDDLWTGAAGQYEGFEGFAVSYGAHGQRSHYGPERYGYPAGLHWVLWNRDPNRHEHNGLVSWSGLSWAKKQRVAELLFGEPNLLDDPRQAFRPGPPTAGRIELARFLMVRALLKDSLTLCDWVFPNYCCPDPGREHAGDLSLEAELYREVTGEQVSAAELDLRAEALVDLYRALTVRSWGTTDLRGAAGYTGGGRGEDHGGDFLGHDNLASWYFEVPLASAGRPAGGSGGDGGAGGDGAGEDGEGGASGPDDGAWFPEEVGEQGREEPPGGPGPDGDGVPAAGSGDPGEGGAANGAANGAAVMRHLDRAEFEQAKTLIYRRMGWDPRGGAPTRDKLVALGQAEVADGLAALGLLPEG
ncbi:MAG: hypothetical protein FJ125_04215 [Deltaproteobacteria bacterium]|nr:hypothetical protein [Deltaproteobacteria bacterium]